MKPKTTNTKTETVTYNARQQLLNFVYKPVGERDSMTGETCVDLLARMGNTIEECGKHLGGEWEVNTKKIKADMESMSGGIFFGLCLGYLSFAFPHMSPILGAITGMMNSIAEKQDRSILEDEILHAQELIAQVGQLLEVGLKSLQDELAQIAKLIGWTYALGETNSYYIFVRSVLKEYETIKDSTDEKKKKEFAEALLEPNEGAFVHQMDTFYHGVMGKGIFESDLGLLDQFANATGAKIQDYNQWLAAFQHLFSLVNMTILHGAYAVLWAAELVKPSLTAGYLEQYKEWFKSLYKKGYSIEPGVFTPVEARHLPFIYQGKNPGGVAYDFCRDNGNDIIKITNKNAEKLNFGQLIVYSNVEILDYSGDGFWGTLRWEKNLLGIQQFTIGDITHVYVLTYPEGTCLEPGEIGDLNYSYSGEGITKIGGLQGAAGLPSIQILDITPAKTRRITATVSSVTVINDDLGEVSWTPPENPVPAPTIAEGKRVVGYFPDYCMYRPEKYSYSAANIPYTRINVLSYCFIKYDEEGNVMSMDPWADEFHLPFIQQMMAANPYLKVELLFGGWPSEVFPSDMIFRKLAASETARNNFAMNAAATIQRLGFSGIGIDWEYPKTDDAENFIKLLNAIRNAMSEVDIGLTLSIDVPAGKQNIAYLNEEQWAKVAAVVDHVNVMTYDFFGGWSQYSGFLAPMQLSPENPAYPENPDNSVEGAMGIYDQMTFNGDRVFPREKLAVGIPIYGRAVLAKPGLVNSTNKGLYVELITPDPQKGIYNVPYGEFDDPGSGKPPSGMFDYNYILDGKNGEHTDKFPADLTFVEAVLNNGEGLGSKAKTPWAYSPGKGWLLSYEDFKSALNKANWIEENKFGGVILWDLSGDKQGEGISIVDAVFNVFGAPVTLTGPGPGIFPKIKNVFRTIFRFLGKNGERGQTN